MSLVNPAALFFAALAIPIIIFYILKIRLRRVPVSTLMFWRQVFEEKKPRSIWQRLRHLISLLLQLAFLGLLVFALADPIFRWQQAGARRIVVILDNSASMNARDVLPSRLDAARAEAGRIIDGLRLGDELALVAAGTQPEVHCGLTDHQRTLHKALDAIPASDGPTRIPEAVALAKRLLAASDKTPRIIVLTDGAFDQAETLGQPPDVQVVAVGKPTGNVGITRLQARRSLLDPIGYEILVEVHNASETPASCRLELDLDNDPVDVVPLALQPGQLLTQIFEKTSADGGILHASIDHDDALVTDNNAFAILPRRERLRVTLVTTGNLFLEKVLEAIPLVDLTISREPPPASATGITVFHRQVPSALPKGPVLVIEPESSTALWEAGEPLASPVVASQDRESPLMAHIRLDQILMPEARKLTILTPAHILAETASGDPLYAVLDRPAPEGKVVVLTVNLDKSDLPLQTAFPILVTNLLADFAGSRGELREALAAGSVTSLDLPAEPHPGGERVLRSPDGRVQPLPGSASGTRITIGPLDRCGIWTIQNRPRPGEPPAPPLTRLACNLANRRESDLRPATGLPSAAVLTGSRFAARPIWFYLVASALLLTGWEWLLYQRRWID